MADEVIQALNRMQTELSTDLKDFVRGENRKHRDEMNTGFDRIYQEIALLRSEYYALKAAVDRIEQQMIEQQTDRLALRSELNEVKIAIAGLEGRVAEIEAKL